MRKGRRTMVKRKKRIAKENFVETTSAPIALGGPPKEPEVRTDREGIFVDKETGNLNIRPDLDMSFRNDEFNDFGIRLAGFTQSPTDRQYLESLSFNKFMRLFHNQAMYLNHMASYLGSSTDSIMKVNVELDGDRKKSWYANDIALKRAKIFEGEIDALKKTAAESKKKAEEELKKTEFELAATVSVNKSMLAEIEDLKIQLEQAKASSILELCMSKKKAEGEIDALKKTVAESKKKAEEELKKTEFELAATVSVNKSILAEIKDLKIQLEKAKTSSSLKLWMSKKKAEEEIDALKKTAAESKKKAEEELKKTEFELAATVSVNKSMLAEIKDLKIQLEQAKASSILELCMSEIPARYEPSDRFYQLMIDLGQQGFEMLQRALLRHPSLDSAAKTIVESMDFTAIDQEEIDMEES